MANSGSFDITNVSGAAEMDQGSAFSKSAIGLATVTFIVGIALMWATMSSVNANQLLSMQEEDAQKLTTAVKPKVQEFIDISDEIMEMSYTAPNLELAEKLGKAEFAIPGGILASVRVPLSGGLTDSVAQYAADSAMLKTMLQDHQRMTAKVDKEEITQILNGEEAVKNNKAFGVVYDVQDVMKNADSEDYQPKRATLVGVRDFKEDEKKYEIEYLSSGKLAFSEPKNLILLDKAQILKAGGQNALTRYTNRVKNIKYQTDKMKKYAPSLLESLERAASGEVEVEPSVDATKVEGTEQAAPAAAEEEAEGDEAPAE